MVKNVEEKEEIPLIKCPGLKNVKMTTTAMMMMRTMRSCIGALDDALKRVPEEREWKREHIICYKNSSGKCDIAK